MNAALQLSTRWQCDAAGSTSGGGEAPLELIQCQLSLGFNL